MRNAGVSTHDRTYRGFQKFVLAEEVLADEGTQFHLVAPAVGHRLSPLDELAQRQQVDVLP